MCQYTTIYHLSLSLSESVRQSICLSLSLKEGNPRCQPIEKFSRFSENSEFPDKSMNIGKKRETARRFLFFPKKYFQFPKCVFCYIHKATIIIAIEEHCLQTYKEGSISESVQAEQREERNL